MIDPSLHALVLELRAAQAGSLTPNPGHQAQALFLDLLHQVDSALATRLHADQYGARSYTVTPLRLPRPRHDRLPFAAGEPAVLRVALLRADLFAPVMGALLQQGLRPTLRLGQMQFGLGMVYGTPAAHPWAGYTAWESLMEQAAPATQLSLEFATPTAVSQGDDAHGRPKVELLPIPATIFGSIARRWNDLAPIQLDPAAIRAASETVVVADHDIRTTTVQMGNTTTKGFLGMVRYELRGTTEQRHLLTLLADAAFFLGVGMKTARGMGLCRRR